VLYLSGVESAGTCRSPCSIAIVGHGHEAGGISEVKGVD
jgi:hypothetical protein